MMVWAPWHGGTECSDLDLSKWPGPQIWNISITQLGPKDRNFKPTSIKLWTPLQAPMIGNMSHWRPSVKINDSVSMWATPVYIVQWFFTICTVLLWIAASFEHCMYSVGFSETVLQGRTLTNCGCGLPWDSELRVSSPLKNSFCEHPWNMYRGSDRTATLYNTFRDINLLNPCTCSLRSQSFLTSNSMEPCTRPKSTKKLVYRPIIPLWGH